MSITESEFYKAHDKLMARLHKLNTMEEALMSSMVKYKTPICEKCGKALKGKVSFDTTVICYFCANPLEGEQDQDTNWKDKRD